MSERTTIHQEICIAASPAQVYSVLTSNDKFSSMTGDRGTSIEAVAGTAFHAFDGIIEGLQLELVPNQRIVQAWRIKDWESGVYTIVRIDLHADGAGTKLIFDQSGIPSGQDHLEPGWHKMYWEPLRACLAG